MKILLVEEDKKLFRLLSECLGDEGHIVEVMALFVYRQPQTNSAI
jgi:DNA-binding response OmpR family regulator